MSYILHTESGQKFEIDGKTSEQVKEAIKAAGLTIGNVTVARLVEGTLTQASGFERIESLTEEEQQEQDRAVAEVNTQTELKANEQEQLSADANQTTAPGVVTGGDGQANVDETVNPAPADAISEVAPNLPNETAAPHTDTPDELAPGNVTPEGEVRSAETSITEPAGDTVLTTSKDPNTESTLTQGTNADGTNAAPGVAATDVDDVNAPAPADQTGVGSVAPVDNIAEGQEGESLRGVDLTQEGEVAKDPLIEQRTQESQSSDADAIRRRMLGNNAADALREADNATDDAARLAAEKKLKGASVTPSTGDAERKRRHNRREDTVETARQGKNGDAIRAIEAGVTPKLVLNYVNPDERWLEFVVADKADAEKPHARTNTYVDLSPLKEGGYQFGLYVNGKSMKSTIKRVRVGKDEDVVAALNGWLPGALTQAGV